MAMSWLGELNLHFNLSRSFLQPLSFNTASLAEVMYPKPEGRLLCSLYDCCACKAAVVA
jgi:hypothetical protein